MRESTSRKHASGMYTLSLNLVQKLGQVIPGMEQLPPVLLDFEIELAHGG